MIEKQFRFDERIFTARSEKSLSDVVMDCVSDDGGVRIYRIDMRFCPDTAECDAVIFWDELPAGITGCWTPCGGRGRHIPQNWYPQRQYSTLTDGAPVLSLFNDSTENYRTVAVSESEKPFEISTWLRNDPGHDTLRMQVAPFKNAVPGTDRFSFYLRIDERRLPLARCIGEVSRWWHDFYPFEPKPCSDCDMPLFSSWYACFQNPTQSVLERELPVIAELGFKSMIIDDGWSYDGKGDGSYSYCGSWEVSAEKFPDMDGFVKKAHFYGIKVALWFPVPFIGKLNSDYNKFKGMMLAETMGAGVLDPRFPEARKYIINSYVHILKKYGFDGLKLDFLTDFNRPAQKSTVETDCETVDEGVSQLLASIGNEVRPLKDDMLIEYRVTYIGPSIVRRCNMLRMCDCAFDFITNRIGTVDLRMLNYPISVHSDMLMWSKNETPENIAVMLLNVMFSVPQISVLTVEMNEEQREVIKNHLVYWSDHSEILLHGALTVSDPQANYSLVCTEDENLKIAVLYLPRIFSFDGKSTDIFNAGSENCIYIDCEISGTAVCYDIFGNNTETVTFSGGTVKLPVPRGGKVELRRS